MALGRKTGGRKKGTPNRRTIEVQGLLERLNCDPIAGMAMIAVDEKNPAELRGRMFAELARYLFPRRKPIEAAPPDIPGLAPTENRPAPAPLLAPRQSAATPAVTDPEAPRRFAAIAERCREALARGQKVSQRSAPEHWLDSVDR